MVCSVPGGSGSRIDTAPSTPGGTSEPDSSRIRTSYPGTGLVGDPGLIGSASRPRQFAATGQPVSVCHQWSITGTPSRSDAQWYVSGLSRSPARNSARNPPRSWSARCVPFGCSFLIARNAVGAVNSVFTPWSAMTRQNAPGSGVPTGLPS
jgi:hypothetical protein